MGDNNLSDILRRSSDDIVLNLLAPSDIRKRELGNAYQNRRKYKNNVTKAEIIRNLPFGALNDIDNDIGRLMETSYIYEPFERTEDGTENANYIRQLINAREVLEKINPKTEDADELLGETAESVKRQYKTEKGYRDFLFHKSINPKLLNTKNENSSKLEQIVKKKHPDGFSYADFKKEMAYAGPKDLDFVFKKVKKMGGEGVFKENAFIGNIVPNILLYIKALKDLKTSKKVDLELEGENEEEYMQDEDDEDEDDELERRLRNLRMQNVEEAVFDVED
jgi:hypothetical protein